MFHPQILSVQGALKICFLAAVMQISAEQVPSLHRVAPEFLKLVTSSNFCPFMFISALMFFVPLVMILLFTLLTSSPYVIALSTSLSVRS